jgi:hypothetical protein
MFVVDATWPEGLENERSAIAWAKENCPSYVAPEFRVVRTALVTCLSYSRFEFTDEADAIIFALKWK